MNIKHVLVAISVIVFLVVSLGALFIWNAFFRSHYLDERLAEDLAVSAEWTDIETVGTIQVKKDHQYVSLGFEQPYSVDKMTGSIKTPKGEIAHPEVRIVDSSGKEWPLVRQTERYYANLQYANYGFPDGLQLDAKFDKVRIRSDIPISIRAVLWSGYNLADQP